MSRTLAVAGYTACGLFCLACLIGTALALRLIAALKGDGVQVDPTDEQDELPPDTVELSGNPLARHVAAFPPRRAPGMCQPGCPCRPTDEVLTEERAARIWDKVQAGINADRRAAAARQGERGGIAQYPPFNPGGGGRS